MMRRYTRGNAGCNCSGGNRGVTNNNQMGREGGEQEGDEGRTAETPEGGMVETPEGWAPAPEGGTADMANDGGGDGLCIDRLGHVGANWPARGQQGGKALSLLVADAAQDGDGGAQARGGGPDGRGEGVTSMVLARRRPGDDGAAKAAAARVSSPVWPAAVAVAVEYRQI